MAARLPVGQYRGLEQYEREHPGLVGFEHVRQVEPDLRCVAGSVDGDRTRGSEDSLGGESASVWQTSPPAGYVVLIVDDDRLEALGEWGAASASWRLLRRLMAAPYGCGDRSARSGENSSCHVHCRLPESDQRRGMSVGLRANRRSGTCCQGLACEPAVRSVPVAWLTRGVLGTPIRMSRDGQDRHLRAEFDGIAGVLRAGSEAAVYAAIVSAAVRAVSGCAHAAVSVMRRGEFATLAASDDVARRLDELQAETGDGPCLDVVTSQAWEHRLDLATAQPTLFNRRLREETPIRSVLALRLIDDDRKTGALNLAADIPHAFTDDAAEQAAILAGFATVAVTAYEERRRRAELERGLDTSREIGVAIGIIAASHGISPNDAFDVLVRASQEFHRKLREVAREVVRSAGPMPG